MIADHLKPQAEAAIKHNAQRLRLIEAEYVRVKNYLLSKDWQDLRDLTLNQLADVLGQFRGDATQAVFILGKCSQIISQVQKPLDIIREYESLKKSTKELAAEI